MDLGMLRLLGVTIVALTLAISVNAQSSCSDGFTKHNDDCYKVLFINATWVHARELCRAIGARLMSIESHDEQNFISGHINNINSAGFAHPNIYWVGANDLAQFSIFLWIHSDAHLTYTNWSPNEPNNFFGHEHCMEIYNNHKWNDEDCKEKRNFICEASKTV